jgi:hypothetical protein
MASEVLLEAQMLCNDDVKLFPSCGGSKRSVSIMILLGGKKMRRVVVVLALAVMAMSVAASADVINDKHGSVHFTTAGIVSTVIQVSSFTGFVTPANGVLGHLTFSTGQCLTGCNSSGIPLGGAVGSTATFSSVGSVFNIICAAKSCGGYGTSLFQGAFTGTVTLTEIAIHGQGLVFDLTGKIMGMLANGMTVTGNTSQTIFTATAQLANGVAHIANGQTVTAPEPGTLGLLGTGLIGIAGLLRRKIFSA